MDMEDGVLYLVVQDYEKVDKWGQPLDTRGKSVGTPEAPPRVSRLAGFRVINSLRIRRIPTDNPNMVLYYRDDEEGSRFFYQKEFPFEFQDEEEKVLYVFFQQELIDPASAKFVDKAGVEYELIGGSDLLKHMLHGVPVTIALPPPVPKNRPRISQEPVRTHMSQEGSGSHVVNPHGPRMYEPRGRVSWAEPPKTGL